jgi:hypothetical protein
VPAERAYQSMSKRGSSWRSCSAAVASCSGVASSRSAGCLTTMLATSAVGNICFSLTKPSAKRFVSAAKYATACTSTEALAYRECATNRLGSQISWSCDTDPADKHVLHVPGS